MVRRIPELTAGFAVIVVAAFFLVYALRGAGEISAGGGYPLRAQFSSIGGLTLGADVKIGGVVIGHVASEQLDPNTYAAIVKMAINNGIKVPDDSSASITSDSLLGGSYVAVSPGGSNNMMKPGASFPVTQSAVNIEDLLGKFIFSMGSGTSKGPSGGGQNQSSGTVQPGNPAALSP
jgi:phospholipid/cholesterol/gamma-HCH transport system substrate-binding protein